MKGRIFFKDNSDNYLISVHYDEFDNRASVHEFDVIEQLSCEECPSTCVELAQSSIEDLNAQLYKAGADELTEDEKEFIVDEIEISYALYEIVK